MGHVTEYGGKDLTLACRPTKSLSFCAM